MIYDILPVNSHKGNNLSVQFDFDFYIENPEQLNVFHYDKNNAKTKLTYDIDYSINELKNKNGSYIIFPKEGSVYNVLGEEERLSLELTLPISQETQYNNSSLLNLEALEYSLDYLTRLIQILSKRLNSCIEINDYTSENISDLIQNVITCAKITNDAYENMQKIVVTSASKTNSGVVQIGSGIEVENGVISVNAPDISLS
ncbi:hypothetical protein IJ531_05080, partial [bacterium]|nr:hypothetical protein [bacterium]